jgi:predicted nucleotidyltransferase
MIPDFYDGQFLPDGDHEATWIEVQERFGSGERRGMLCEQMSKFIQIARGCGFRSVYLFGSFISGKENPKDIDLMWVYRQKTFGLLRPGCRELLNYATMKARWNWDMFCCSDDPGASEYMLPAWRMSKTGTKRGIIKIDLERFEGLIL